MKKTLLAFLTLFAFTAESYVMAETAISLKQERPAIVLVAFGTSVPQAREVYAHIDAEARRRYPDHEIAWAFTSQFIIDKLRRQGIETRNVEETIRDLRAKGYASVAFQSLHVAPGEEYAKVEAADTSGMRVAYGDALMTSDADIDAVIEALAGDVHKDAPTVVVLHGNGKYPRFNERLLGFARKMEERHPGATVASVEGEPGISPLQRARRAVTTGGAVHFLPLMVVAGDHILNDVLGDDPQSWRNTVGATTVSCAPSLGWNGGALDIWFSHLDAALAALACEGE